MVDGHRSTTTSNNSAPVRPLMVTLLPAGNRFTTGGSAAGAEAAAGAGAGAGAAGAATAVSTTVGAAGTWVFTNPGFPWNKEISIYGFPKIGVPQNGWLK